QLGLLALQSLAAQMIYGGVHIVSETTLKLGRALSRSEKRRLIVPDEPTHENILVAPRSTSFQGPLLF
ncbi:MAG: hypothetical protein VXX31_08155, partial [Planctomycetota bacterium]|nr:hypothetical protein [Planctomycetota bacterium]